MSANSALKTRFLPIALVTIVLAACQSTPVKPLAQTSAAAVVASTPLLRQDAFTGIYEVAALSNGSAVFVATVDRSDSKNGGFVHRLDARTLQTVQTVHLPRHSFALGLNESTQTLYVGNTMDGSLTVVDAASGFVKGVIQLAEPKVNDKGETSYAHTRKVIVDQKHNRVFVTSPGRPGLVWIVDGATNKLTHTITSDGPWSAGAAYDAASNRLYVGQGGVNEVLVINPDTAEVVRRLSTGETPNDPKAESANFFINISLDTKGQRLFAAGGQKNQVYVLNLANGEVLKRIPYQAGSLDILFNPVRNELVTTHRGSGDAGLGFVSIIDAATYQPKRRVDLPVHPNSLALSPDGQTLYVTVKTPGKNHVAWRKDGKDSVVRIDLKD